jgi:hypothetical protein
LEDGKWVFVLFLVFFYKNGKYTEGSLSFSLSIDYVNSSKLTLKLLNVTGLVGRLKNLWTNGIGLAKDNLAERNFFL